MILARPALGGVLVAAALAGAPPRSHAPPPPIRHVFVIVLENQGFEMTFGADSAAPYLSDTMVAAGAWLRQYYGIGHFSLGNYIAMISGIAPDSETQRDCARYTEFVETGTARHGQPVGQGCVYPAHVPTIATQLAARHLRWRAYLEDMGADTTREAATCGHPLLGALDSTQRAAPNDQYAAKHNPFVYFHAILDSATCRTDVVSFAQLATDLGSSDPMPAFSFIVPNLCHDGHDQPCADGEPGGLESADAFLAHWVPLLTASPGFQKDGLLIVTFDEATMDDATACCDEPTGPNTRSPGLIGPGGGRVGAVLLSPFIRPGTVSDVPYNHYSLLRSVEVVFQLGYLGYAGRPGLTSFGPDVYTRSTTRRH
jgi:hypothetical protein